MTTPDARPADGTVDALAALQKQLDDLTTTMAARTSRRPTGDIEMTIRTVPKPDSLIMQGQTVNRDDYPALWQWVTDQSLIKTGLFGSGNGSTTFVLPDFRGRAVAGATAARVPGAVFGAATVVITPANMAAHTHQVGVSVGSATNGHQHGFNTAGVGDHGFHRPNEAPGPAGGGAAWTAIGHIGEGAHGHGGVTANDGPSHNHFVAVGETSVGANTPISVEPPSISVNWLIYV